MVKHQTLSWVTVVWGSAGTHFFSFHLQIGQKLSNASMSPFPLRPGFYEKSCLPPRRKKEKAREDGHAWSITGITGITGIQTGQTCTCVVQLSIVMHINQ